MKKIVFLAFISALLLTAIIWGFIRPPVGNANRSDGSYRDGKFVFASSSKTIRVPDDFTSIQGAINNANDGDTIFVRAGTYYENLVVYKSLTLVGESKESTIVDGSGENRSVIEVTANNVVINKFTVQNSSRMTGTSYPGIKVLGRACNITGNHVTKNKIGIFVTSQKSRIAENIVTNNDQGIALYGSSEVEVEANNVSANTVGISLAFSFNNMIVGNRATNSSIGGHGIILSSNSFDNTIFSNDLMNNYHGMWLSSSSNNWIVENTIADNELLGIELAISPDNTFYHNNFINNPQHVVIQDSVSIWDNGYPSGGNYWSDYNGTDENQDGIGDTPYIVDANGQDNFPLTGMSYDFTVEMGWEQIYHVHVISNSTVSNLELVAWLSSPNEYLQPGDKFIRFDVAGEEGSVGFCRIMIPRVVLNDSYVVLVNWLVEVPFIELPTSNSTYAYLYFTYTQPNELMIVPEFPTWTSILLILIVLTFAIAIYKRRLFCCS